MATKRLQETYKEIIPGLQKDLNVPNVFMVPRIKKIVVNCGLGEALSNKKVLETMAESLIAITGQRPVQTRAKRAIATFKLQQGQAIGLKITLRGKRMYAFLEKVNKVVLPRIRDFRGIGDEGFDGKGNFTFGFAELIVFPEIDYTKLDKIRGFEATVVTTGKSKEDTKKLLTLLGVPFKKENTGRR